MKKLVLLIVLILGLCLAFPGNILSNDMTSQDQSQNITKIVGGKPVEDDSKYPWMVALVKDANFPDLYAGQFCGGTLIAPEWVLTAAHCVTSVFTNFHAVLGTTSLTAPPGRYERIAIRRVLRHNDYDPHTNDNDIALLQLVSPSSMTPISGLVQTDNYVPFETMFTLIGWGSTEFQGDFPEQLQEVSVPYVDNQTCQTTLEQVNMGVTDNMLCAGAWEGGKDSCQGDSGGPLIAQVMGRDVLAGIVSFGYGCAVRAKPGVNTRVSRYNGWVKSTARSECVFDALEQEFPQYFTRPTENSIFMTTESEDMKYRSYPLSNSFLGLQGDQLIYSGELSGYELTDLGALGQWAENTGCVILR